MAVIAAARSLPHVLLACAVGLSVGTAINRFTRYLQRLAERSETGY